MKNVAPDSSTSGERLLNEVRALQDQLTALRSEINDDLRNSVGEIGLDDAAKARAILAARRARDNYFGENMFADPAWDLLLTLYLKDLEQHRITVSEACTSAAVPATTALRWLGKLEKQGWAARIADQTDRRRVWLDLTAVGKSAMQSYFIGIGRTAPI